ncbi:hypothetical protein SpCBS45565_g08284 [Spizellomyces sp. 'palustris']|nr:hypothetical protein SpCBS45565_g08284 [Spizellomyces sp. 'palustris']
MSADLVGSLLSSLSLQGDADGLIPHCPYDFIIAVDLEATCDENHADPSAVQVPRDKGEIIELSYAVVSVPERRIVHQRQNFVRPIETTVTAYCTQLTGITPELVENAGTLREAVEDLLSFIQTNPQSTFCFMAHGEWDFRFQLPRECQEKAIPLPPLFGVFFDITKEVHRMITLSAGVPRPASTASLLSLCKAMGLQHEGRLHSGLDDAVTVARLAIILLQRVHTWFAEKGDGALPPGLELPLSIPIDLGQEIEDFAVARSRVVRLGGVPFKATQTQVLTFIGESGVTPESMWMIKNAEGRSDGRGLVVLHTHEDAMAALSLNGRVMGDRVVQVTPGSEVDLEETAAVRGPFLTDFEAQQATPSQEVKPGDWLCPTCQFHNFASRRSCSKCHAVNPSPTPYVSNQPLKPGDWICQDPTCTFQNFASRMLCMRCRGPRPAGMELARPNGMNGTLGISFLTPDGTPVQQRPQEVRPGDWFCPNCQFHNFASRRNCVKCSLTVTLPAPPRSFAPNKPGDWACPNPACGFHNFQYRNECKVCQTVKPAGMEYHPAMHMQGARPQLSRPVELRPGDWLCPHCQTHNFASRRACMKCNASMHVNGGMVRPHHHKPSSKNNLRPGDWLCPDPTCAFWNFKSKTACTRCGRASVGAQIVPEGYNGGTFGARREGDWDCPIQECGFHNFRSRTECHRCGAMKPVEE